MQNPGREITYALQAVSPILEESRKKIETIIIQKKYTKGDHLLELWKIDRYLHYILSGSARVYYLREGHDITDYFAREGQFIGGVESLFTGEPSHKAIELSEDSVVQSFLYSDFEDVCYQHHDIERLGSKPAIFAFWMHKKIVESIRFLSAAERYQKLEQKYPGISNRFPL